MQLYQCVDGISWLCSFIYHYQTLITGILAIGAAWYAGAPVWRQLKDSNLQTRMLHRETLSMRLKEEEQLTIKLKDIIEQPLYEAGRVTSDPDGEPIKVGPHEAFNVETLISTARNQAKAALRNNFDPEVENAKSALFVALDDLATTLDDVSVPARIDQHEYNLSDEKWVEIEQKAKEAETLAAAKVSEVWKAHKALQAARTSLIAGLRGQIARLDESITKGT
ncbi:hypothetical protein [Altererythrobacter litoralis]|uniref:Uncharacterized protein n=1 Tax=Altererythrobacter litoralis TaxID=3113904 RepID=A0ABU7GHY0_9SPHN|nr:hypothetical protein [Erythrobacteraceae bacterium 1XM1-14]